MDNEEIIDPAGLAVGATGLSGFGEVVLHNLKNLGHALQVRCGGSSPAANDQDIRAYGDAVCRLFREVRRICERSVADGYLASDVVGGLTLLLKDCDEDAVALRAGQGNLATVTRMAAFLNGQYMKKGLLFDVLKGETVCLFSDLPLTPVELALRKVVRTLVPEEWLGGGRLFWEDTGRGKVLCFIKTGSGSVLRLGVTVMPSELAPKDLRRILEVREAMH